MRDRESYRPVSLTPVPAKVMERLVLGRLTHWMEANKVINGWQAGFQRGRGTEEQVLGMVQGIHDRWCQGEKTVLVTLDCSRAYDRVWKTRLMERMMDERVPAVMVKWFRQFLEGRQARVRVGDGRSKWRLMKEGLPQGAVTSPALFLLYANEWEGLQEEGVEYSAFADDLALWASGKRLDEVERRVQRALWKVERWAVRNRVMLNPGKSECCILSKRQPDRQQRANLVIGGAPIETKKAVKYLGVLVEGDFSFRQHAAAVMEKMRKRARVLRALAGRTWGCGWVQMRQVYRAIVESVVWYAAAAWLPWLSTTLLRQLEVVQREGLREVTGLTRTAPCEAVYLEAQIDPISVELRRRALMMHEKAARGKEGTRLVGLVEEGSSAVRGERSWRSLAVRQARELIPGERLRLAWERRKPWQQLDDRGVTLVMGGEGEAETRADEERAGTQGAAAREPQAGELLCYTDGSVEGGFGQAGAACVWRMVGREGVERCKVGRNRCSYTAEAVAMGLGLEVARREQPARVVVMTDSQALVGALASRGPSLNTVVEGLKEGLWELARDMQVKVQWVRGHAGLPGNEQADREANRARQQEGEMEEMPMWLEDARSRVRAAVRYEPELSERMRGVYGRGIRRDEGASRKEQVRMAQLRAGHCPGTQEYECRVGRRSEDRCQDCGEKVGKDHWLECSRGEKWRRIVELRGPQDMAEEGKVVRFLRQVYPEWVQ